MKPRPQRILRLLSSIAVGTMAFCLTLPAVLLFGGILLGTSMPDDVLIPPQLVILVLISMLAAGIVGIWAGIKYYRYIDSNKE